MLVKKFDLKSVREIISNFVDSRQVLVELFVYQTKQVDKADFCFEVT
jgi:hypothetical protein